MRHTIYIAHEYGDESHFKALYEKAQQYGYSVSGQIILKNRSFLGKIYKAIFKRHKLKEAIEVIRDRIKFYFIKNQILIVGIAPYNKHLNKYKRIFKRNQSYYFTSQIKWDGSDCIKGTINNKEKFEKLLSECFQGAFCVSRVSEHGVSKYIDKTRVVNHSINVNEYRYSMATNEPIKLLYIGQYVERKNICLLLQWIKDNPNTKFSFSFMGRGELEKEINSLCEQDDRVVNKGFCSKDILKQTICEYDYLLLPSEEEPFGIVLIEALACGVPCIVSDAVGPSEIIKDGYNGFIFSLKEKYTSFAQVMKRVIETSEKEQQILRQNAYKSGLQFDTSQIVLKWMELLNNGILEEEL